MDFVFWVFDLPDLNKKTTFPSNPFSNLNTDLTRCHATSAKVGFNNSAFYQTDIIDADFYIKATL